MHKIGRHEIIKVLQEVDRLIDFECELVLIGGTAIIVGHGSDRGTKDTETWNSLNDRVRKAWDTAIRTLGLNLQIDTAAAIAQAPYNFEDRLQTLNEVSLRFLKVKFPDPYDLALMKVCRNADIDREDILHLHQTYNLDPDTLLTRMKSEMVPYYIGDPRDLILKYLFVVEILFGEEVASLQEAAFS